MKGKLCYIALLLLSIISIPTFCVFSDVNALKHEYDGVFLGGKQVPLQFTTDENGNSIIDWDTTPSVSTEGFRLKISFFGDSWYDELEDLKYIVNSSYSDFSYDPNSNTCYYLTGGSAPHSLLSSFNKVTDTVHHTYSTYIVTQAEFSPEYYMSSSPNLNKCHHRSAFGSQNTPPFNFSSLPGLTTTMACDNSTGAVCGALRISTTTYLNDNLLPDYWFTYDGFYTHHSAIDTNSGIHYNHSFSFSDILNQPIKKFSALTIPLYNADDSYWLDGSNFTFGRHFEWKGAFDFDESVTFHENIDSNGSQFIVDAIAYNPNTSSSSHITFPCVMNLRTVPDANDFRQIEYSCSGDLPFQTPFLLPALRMTGGGVGGNGTSYNSTYIWTTEGDWRWAGMFLVTDNDETPGESFNSELHGSFIPGSVTAEDMSDGNEDWFSSLTNLFNFNFINPFAPIFQLFTNQSTCASIPTLASMLHSNETQVCPWFDNTTRAIVTPVLGIASVMLVFGFAVRWLGSSSGNLFEDSHETDNYNFSNKFRRKRG